MKNERIARDLTKAELLREAESQAADLIEEAVTWHTEHPDATWDELELEVLQLRQRFGAQLAQTLAQHRAERKPVPGPVCPECGKDMHYKGPKARQLVSMLGEVTLKRGYYYCAECGQSVFPPGSGTGSEEEDVESAVDADADVVGRATTV